MSLAEVSNENIQDLQEIKDNKSMSLEPAFL